MIFISFVVLIIDILDGCGLNNKMCWTTCQTHKGDTVQAINLVVVVISRCVYW